MIELLIFLRELSFGEFIIIWIATILLVFFSSLFIYHLIQIKKDTNLLKINIREIINLLEDE